jgi:predicted  nucleic acid-binding Zn-ribbon protein
MHSVTLSSGYAITAPSSPDDDGLYLHIPDVSGLEGLPQCGTITFKYKRKELSLGEDRLSARLCLLEITDVEADEECETEKKTDSVVDELFKEAQKSKADEIDGDDSGEGPY